MVKQLPQSGLVVIILGADHNLAGVLGDDTEYLRVKVQAPSRQGKPWLVP